MKNKARSVLKHDIIQRIVFSSFYIIAGVIILSICFGLAFLFYKGLIKTERIEKKFVPLTTENRGIGEDKLLFYTSPNLALDSLELESIEGLLSGRIFNWRPLHQEEIKQITVIADKGLEGREKFSPFLDWNSVLFEDSSNKELINQRIERYHNIFMVIPSSSQVSFEKNYPLFKAVKLNRFVLISSKGYEHIKEKEWEDNLSLHQKKEGFYSLVSHSLIKDSIFQEISEKKFINKLKKNEVELALVDSFWAKEHKLKTVSIEEVHRGWNISWSFLFGKPIKNGELGGIGTIIINTLLIVLLTLLVAVFFGIGTAVYLIEYSPKGFLQNSIRLAIETLAGIPSIIFGLFGYLFFVNILGLGVGVLSGVLTLSIMIMPTLIRITEEALKNVPKSYREGALALGSQKWYVIFSVVIPTALPAIIAGIILGIGRIFGETAAVIFTLGTSYQSTISYLPKFVQDFPTIWHNLLDNPSLDTVMYTFVHYPLITFGTSMRTLAVHLYWMIIDGISFDRGYATAVVLIFVIIIVNMFSQLLMYFWNKRRYGG